MLKSGQSYFIDYYLNQKVYSLFLNFIEDYALFVDFNQSKKRLGYRLALTTKYKFKKMKITLEYQHFEEFSSVVQLLEYLKDQQRIIRIDTSKKSIQGYIIILSDDFLLLQLVDPDAEKNGILMVPINYIDSIYWDGDDELRLERLVAYTRLEKKIDDVIESCSKGNTLCEIYHSGFQTFILGKCLKVTDNHFLIESVDASDEVEGFVLLHSGLIDYICFETKYIKTFHISKDVMQISSISELFESIINKKIKIDITTERKKEYRDLSLISYDEEKITVQKNKKKKVFTIEEIDILDACRK